jgi:hypothetical protein
MGLSLKNTLGLSSSVPVALTACYWKFSLLHYMQVLCQCRLCKADHVYLMHLILQQQLSHLNCRKLDHRHRQLLSKSKLGYDLSVGQSLLEESTHLGLTTTFLLLLDYCGFVDVGRSIWQEGGSAFYNCCWSSPAQSFSGPSPAGLVTKFYSFRFETPTIWRGMCPYLYPQEQGGPLIPPSTGFPFHRLLLLGGLRWRYSNPPPRWVRFYLSLNTYSLCTDRI